MNNRVINKDRGASMLLRLLIFFSSCQRLRTVSPLLSPLPFFPKNNRICFTHPQFLAAINSLILSVNILSLIFLIFLDSLTPKNQERGFNGH